MKNICLKPLIYQYQLCLELCHRMYYDNSDIRVLVHPRIWIELPDSHGKTIYPTIFTCIPLLPVALTNNTPAVYAVPTSCGDCGHKSSTTLRSRNSISSALSVVSNRSPSQVPDTGLKLEKQIICATTEDYVPKFQLTTIMIITTSHSSLTNCNYCLVIVTIILMTCSYSVANCCKPLN